MNTNSFIKVAGLFTAVFLMTDSLFGQVVEDLEFQKVIEVPALSSNELYTKAIEWFAVYYKDAQEVVQLKDEQNHKIIGKGAYAYSSGAGQGALIEGFLRYSVNVECRDGRTRVTIGQIIHSSSGYNNPSTGYAESNFGLLTTAGAIEKDAISGQGMGHRGNNGWRQKSWDDMKRQASVLAEDIFQSLENHLIKSVTEDDDW